MEFINEEFIKTNELNDTQVAAITKAGADYIANLQNDWDGRANENAEKIIEGAGKKQIETTGIERNQGEKWADYLTRSTDGYLLGSKASLDRKQTELDEKIKNAGSDETLKAELISAKDKIEGLQKIEAEHAEWVKGDYKNLFEKANGELSATRKQVAYGNVKPKFADGVNEYEAKAKWNEFVKKVDEKYEIHLDDNNDPLYVDKENKFKTGKLSDLVKEDQELQALVKGRQLNGLGAKIKLDVDIEGVPFKVPENATPTERQKAIKEYITGDLKTPEFSPKYPALFADFNKKILEKTPA